MSVSPSPMLIWISQWSQCFKTRVAQHWGGRRHISWGKTVWRRNLRIFVQKFDTNGVCFNDLWRVLQYSSKILKHLCLFPLPQCWFGYHSGLSASKHAWLNIGEGEGTFHGGKQCEEEISGFLCKNSTQTVSVSTICDEYCNTRQKSWNTCVCFPFPNVDLDITVVSVLQNTRGSTLGREKAHFMGENSVK